jgi:hypothetical protein
LYYNKKYYDIKDVAQSTMLSYDDEVQLLIIAMLLNEFVDVPKSKAAYQSASKAYTCLHSRRSWCSTERMNSALYNYCGGRPSYIGGTDCGCLWGDFFCICITEFSC